MDDVLEKEFVKPTVLAPTVAVYMITHDLRYAARVLRKEMPVTIATIVILALGIGASTLVFSLANGFLLRPLPYGEPNIS